MPAGGPAGSMAVAEHLQASERNHGGVRLHRSYGSQMADDGGIAGSADYRTVSARTMTNVNISTRAPLTQTPMRAGTKIPPRP